MPTESTKCYQRERATARRTMLRFFWESGGRVWCCVAKSHITVRVFIWLEFFFSHIKTFFSNFRFISEEKDKKTCVKNGDASIAEDEK